MLVIERTPVDPNSGYTKLVTDSCAYFRLKVEFYDRKKPSQDLALELPTIQESLLAFSHHAYGQPPKGQRDHPPLG